MTNASKISSVSVIFLSALVLVSGAFAKTANAQFDDGNIGYFETGDSATYFDTSTPDYSNYYDTSSPDYSNYYDTSAPDYADYYDTSAPDYADYYDTSTPDYGTEYGTDEFGTDTFGTDTYGTDYIYENGIGYSYTPTFSAGGFGGTTYAAPRYGYTSTPTTFFAPSYVAPTYPAPHPAPAPTPRPTPTPVVTTPVTNVTNNNNNTNNNVNNNNINVNTSSNAVAIATVTPVQAAPVHYEVQYVQPQPITYLRPVCTITITNYNGNSYGQYGYSQLATLTWSSQNATSGYISPSVGNVSGYGSMQVYPTNGAVYTMTVNGQGGSATCTTQPYYVATPIVNNPSVSLSQIPYTGFDFGTLGNSIYWISLMVFALSAAYLVLYFNGGMFATLAARSTRAQVAMPKIAVTSAPAPIAKAVVAEKSVVSPIQLSSNSKPSDRMHVSHSKAGEMPRISISRE